MDRDMIEYFINETDKKFERIAEDVDAIRKDLRILLEYRRLLLGLSAFTAFIVTLAVEILFK